MAVSSACQMTDYMCASHKAKFWKEGAEKCCEDEEDITDKVIIVTGSNQGIGKLIVEELAKRGAKVVMAVRTVDKGQEAVEDIRSRIGKDAKLDVMRLDLGDLQSVRDFVTEFNGKYPHLNILVNNAGVLDSSQILKKTKDGHELQIGTNHLGPYLLTNLLLDSLKRAEGISKIICLSSAVVVAANLDLDDWMQEEKVKTGNSGMNQYNLSKLCGSLGMLSLAKKLGGSQVKLFQLDPGWVKTNMSEGLADNQSGIAKTVMKASANVIAITPHEACETPVYLAVSRKIADDPEAGKGELYRFKKVWKLGNEVLNKHDKTENAEELRIRTDKLVGLKE